VEVKDFKGKGILWTVMSVEEEVLARLKPTPEEEDAIEVTIKELVERVTSTSVAEQVDFEPVLVGSIAKGTYLKDPDIDLFLMFDPSVPRDELERFGVAVGKEAIGGREHYAEHPYIRGVINGLKADIVPAYRILDASQRMTAVDRTPFHMEYVMGHLAAEKRDEVRLLKSFMKGIGVYSAEAKVQGFSGYLCELLVIRFGGFSEVLQAASHWKKGIALSTEPTTGAKFDEPMVFIDPVDPNRNVASAVSVHSLALFIVATRAYLTAPTIQFFFPNPIPVLDAVEIGRRLEGRGQILVHTLPKPDIIDDILYPQVRKFQKNIAQVLEQREFKVLRSWSGVIDSEIVILLKLESFELPESQLHKGPPVWISENSDDFISKWRASPEALSEPFIENGQWHVFIKRKHINAKELVVSSMSSLDIGKDLNKQKEEVKVYGPEISNEPPILEAMSRFLEKRMPWER
jgi:tRNA nucleotidyltransferase (CCA-adding enzyme)